MIIGTINYQIGMDTSGFESGTILTRREMQLVRKEMRDTRSPIEEIGEKVDALKQAFVNGAVSSDDYHRAMVKLNSETPAALAAQAEYAASVAHADKVLAAIATPLDVYTAELAANQKAMVFGKLTQDQVNTANELARQKLPEVAEAQRQLNADMTRGQQIARANETEIERYNRELAELKRLSDAGAIGERDMAREAERLRGNLSDVTKEQRRLEAELQDGKSLTDSLRTAEERRAAELARARGLLASGAISQDTYNRQLVKHRQEAIAQIPVVGQMSSKFLGVHPAAIAAAAGVAVLAAEMKMAIAIASWLTREVREQFVEIDQLAKSARKLNIGTQDMIGLSEAAQELAGVDFSGFEKSLEQSTRRISEAAAGSGPAASALTEVGLAAGKLNEMSPADSFREIVGALGDVKNTSDQARLAYEIFGKQGMELLPMIRAGREGIAAIEAEQLALGNTLSALDVASIERMNNSWNDSQDVIKGIVRDLAVDLAPAITAVSETLSASLKPGAELGDQLRFALEGIPPVIAWAADKTNLWVGYFQLLGATSKTAAATVVGGLAMIDRAQAAVNPFAGVNDELQVMADSYRRDAAEATSRAVTRISDGVNGSMQADVRRIREENAAAARQNERDLAGGRNVKAEKAAEESSEKMLVTMREQIRTFGLTDAAALSMELRQRAVAAAHVDTSDRLADQVIALNMEADAIDGLATELQRLKDEQAAAAAVKQLTESLAEQLATVGMTADQVARYKLEQQGAAAADVAAIGVTQDLLAAKQQQAAADKQLADSIKSTTEALQFQIATTGMTAEQIEQYKLAQAGATKEQLAAIAALQGEAKARTDQQKLIDEGKAMTDSLMTDEEKKAAAIAKATQLREAGAISEEMYQRAIAKTNDETKAAIALSQGITGAMKGSLEAQQKLDALASVLGGKPPVPEPFPGGFDAGGSAAQPPKTDVEAIRERLNQNLNGPPKTDVEAIRERLNQNLNGPPKTDVEAIRERLNQNLDRPSPDSATQPGSPAAEAPSDFDRAMADITQRLKDFAKPTGSGPLATPAAASPLSLGQPFALSDASAVDRLVEMLAKTNELLGNVATNTAPSTAREPNDNELTIVTVK